MHQTHQEVILNIQYIGKFKLREPIVQNERGLKRDAHIVLLRSMFRVREAKEKGEKGAGQYQKDFQS